MEGVRVAISAATPFETEVLPHYAGLVRRLTLIVADGDEARDLAQTSCLRAWEAWDRFDGVDVRAGSPSTKCGGADGCLSGRE